MNQEQQFANTLEEIWMCTVNTFSQTDLKSGILSGISQLTMRPCSRKIQGNCIGREQVKEAFLPLGFDEKQLEMVFDYLEEQKIGIGEPLQPEDYLSAEEINYLDTYLESLELLEELSAGEREAITLSAMAGDYDAKQKLIEIYLPQVVAVCRTGGPSGGFNRRRECSSCHGGGNAGNGRRYCRCPGHARKHDYGSDGELYSPQCPGKGNRQ